MPYEVQTAVFDGPFDLLLHLILREQVELYDVSLAGIVDGYLRELSRMETLDLEIATEFLLIAATLVELKSRRLLPDVDDGDLDEELALWEERDVLLARLLECKTFKDASVVLARLADAAGRCYPRTAGMEERYLDLAPDLLAGITPADVRDAFTRAVVPRPRPRIDLDHVAPIRASVTDAVLALSRELPQHGRITFRRLTAGIASRIEVIVRFLAVLELYKRGLVDLRQAATCGEIEIDWLVPSGVDVEALATVDAYDG